MHSRKNVSSRVNQRASSPWPSLSAKGEGVSVSERCRRNVTKIVVLTLDCRTNLRDSLQRRRRRPIRRTRPTARTATCACVRAAYHTRDRQRPDAATTTPFGNSLVVCGDGSRRGRPLKNGPAIRRTDESRVELEPCFRPKLQNTPLEKISQQLGRSRRTNHRRSLSSDHRPRHENGACS